MRVIKALRLCLIVSILSVCATITAEAQGTHTLKHVQGLHLDQQRFGEITVYSSYGHKIRAASMGKLMHEATELFEDALSASVNFSIVVLDEKDWPKVRFIQSAHPLPYGDPGLQGPPWVIVLPANTNHGAIVDAIGNLFDAETARIILDNVSIHELGHVYVREYLYPNEVSKVETSHWFDEFMASYFMYTFLMLKYPKSAAVSDKVAQGFLAGPKPQFTSLQDFEREYLGALLKDGNNYGWYQMAFQRQVTEIYAAHGLGFIRKLKQEPPWDKMQFTNTDDLISALERVAPGFEAWAVQLEGAN